MEQIMQSQDNFDVEVDSVKACVTECTGTCSASDSCPLNKCDFSCVNDFPLAMAYIPMQRFENLYSSDEALNAGTLFKDLDKPFCGGLRKGKGCAK